MEVFITYDVTNKESFDKIYYWIKTVKEHISKENNTKIVLIGNKIDLKQERQISEEEGKKMAQDYNLNYYETSAKENIGINELMKDVIKDILNGKSKEENTNKNGINNKEIKLKENNRENERGCSC